MSAYSVKEKLEALKLACEINDIPKDEVLRMTNKILSCMGIEISHDVNNNSSSDELVDFNEIASITGFQFGEAEFLKIAKRTNKNLEKIDKSYYCNYSYSECLFDGSKFNKRLALDMYKNFDIKSNPLFDDICNKQ